MDENKTNDKEKVSFGGRISTVLKKPTVKIAVTAILLIALAAATINLLGNNGDNGETEDLGKKKNVKTQLIEKGYESSIEAVGTVKADSKIAVKALTGGTVRSVNFEVGDKVFRNSTLASLSNNTILTNLINAQTNLINVERNAVITRQLTDETLRQAELDTERAEEAVDAAQIALKAAKDNLKNAQTINDKGDSDVRSSAVISIADKLNTTYSALKQINTIIQADDDNSQIDGIENTLAALKPSSLGLALSAYKSAYGDYEGLSGKQFDTENIKIGMQEIVALLGKTKSAVDATIEVLENTVTSADFSQTALSAQKDRFIGLRATIVGAQTAAERTLQSLQNVGLTSNQQIESLQNAVAAAENQLTSAEINYQNSLIGLANAKTRVERDLASAQSSVDNARSQLSLVEVQASDLGISTPISGIITEKMVELGDEVNPGQTIAEVSQTEKLVIEADLPAEEATELTVGQAVSIEPDGKNVNGSISQIYPTADPVNKKVRIEIVVDNNSGLIAESFVEISMPISKNLGEENDKTSFFVPLKAVSISPNESYVFVVENSRAKKISIETGRTEGTLIEIVSGLEAGQELIIDGNKNVDDGEEINVNN